MPAHEMYRVVEEAGQFHVVDKDGGRVAGPFQTRDQALADGRARALRAAGPSSMEGEDVKVQEDYAGERK
jgi:hypothetical protein